MNPLPTPTSTRPGASSTSVAIDAAVVIGWRRLGISTPGAEPDGRSVRSAQRASVMKTSGYSAGESYSQARRYPSCSARTTWSGVSIEVAKAQEMSMPPSLFPHRLRPELGAIRIRGVTHVPAVGDPESAARKVRLGNGPTPRCDGFQ